MAEGKHTAGGWRVGYDDGSGPEYIVDNVTEEALATIRWGCSCCKSDKPLTLFEINRARLIAAAPDLLAALEKALPLIVAEEACSGGQPGGGISNLLLDVQAAIAKAKAGAA